MGIPFYFYVLARAYPGILSPVWTRECTDYFMDYNGAVHQSARKALHARQDIVETLWKYTRDCVRRAGAGVQRVHLCIDGVAPIAKMSQQRKRRFLNAYRIRELGQGSGSKDAHATWDSNAISPGTPFMADLQQKLRARLPANYTLSGSDEPGEGEQKIFAKIAELPETTGVMIYGLDADLIMLSLLSHRKGLVLMREDTSVSGKGRAPDEFVYLNVDMLRTAILRSLRETYRWPVTPSHTAEPFSQESRLIVETYIILCFLLGNDFLPHPPTLSLKKKGHERLLAAARDYLTESGWPSNPEDIHAMLADVLQKLANEEDAGEIITLAQQYLKRAPFPNAEDPTDSYPLKYKSPLADAMVKAPTKWRGLYYKHLFHARLGDTSIVTSACRAYLQGIHWTLRYYKRECKDPRWFYPYGAAPTMRDFANYVAAEDPSALLKDFVVPNDEGFVHPEVQLCLIMPPESAKILPERVQKLMRGVCSHLYPTHYPIQTFLKMHLWECHPVLPALDVEFVEAAHTHN